MRFDSLTMDCGIRLFRSACPRCRTRCSITREGDVWVVSCHCGRHRFPWLPGERLRKEYPDSRFDVVGFPEHLRHLRRIADSDLHFLDAELRHQSSEAIPAAIPSGHIHSYVVRGFRQALVVAGLRVCARYRARLHAADIQFAISSVIEERNARVTRTRRAMQTHWRRWRDSGMRRAVQSALLASEVPEFPIRTTLNPEDIRLARQWPQRGDEHNREWDERVRSARAAERAAHVYYDSFSETRPVEDVSLTQLGSSSDIDEAWRSYDLTVSGRQIDVKNVRFDSGSESRRPHYSEYLLQPKYRPDRSSRVTIVGVRTRQNDKVFESQILGEWNACIERSLSERALSFSRVGAGAVSVSWVPSRRSPASLPGWLLEFPRSHYSHFCHAWVTRWICIESRIDGTAVPLWLAVIAAAHGCSADRLSLSVRSLVERELLRLLSKFFDGYAPSRPSLVLFVLIWLSHAGHNGYLEPATDALRRGLWGHPYAGSGFTRPLALHDPLEYVSSWTDIFLRLWQSEPSVFSRLRELRLVGWGLLRGKFDGDAKERTLVAYCGGCSRYPLVHGHDDVSPCGCSRARLRCPGCHYCYHSCSWSGRRPSWP